MVTQAHARGLRVIFDVQALDVHQSSALVAQQPSWFWPNQRAGAADCTCGVGCDWTLDADRCWITPELPRWNFSNAQARAYVIDRLVALLQTSDADGLRLDGLDMTPSVFLTDLRTAVDARLVATTSPPRRYLLTGTTIGSRTAVVDPGGALDGVSDLPMRNALVRSVLTREAGLDTLATFVAANDTAFGDGVMSGTVGVSFFPRPIHLGEDTPLFASYDMGQSRAFVNRPVAPTAKSAYERLATAFAILFTSPGAPMVQYGDEIGLAGAGDPDSLRPMPLSPPTGHALTLRDRVKALLAVRALHPALRRGTRATLTSSADAWLYAMTDPQETVYVAVNRGDTSATVTGLPSVPLRDAITGVTVTGPMVTVAPRDVRVLVLP